MTDYVLAYLIIGEAILAITVLTMKTQGATKSGALVACIVFVTLWPLCIVAAVGKMRRGTS